ncbi:MAG: hypothetical protein PHR77_02925 [Kiritimatiellae bacterium]|nr:hypothetical protein [Kiritimatiellia bacterium]MDD5519445.1 hypothetical protein [Kiritimatiellia bacterium]
MRETVSIPFWILIVLVCMSVYVIFTFFVKLYLQFQKERQYKIDSLKQKLEQRFKSKRFVIEKVIIEAEKPVGIIIKKRLLRIGDQINQYTLTRIGPGLGNTWFAFFDRNVEGTPLNLSCELNDNPTRYEEALNAQGFGKYEDYEWVSLGRTKNKALSLPSNNFSLWLWKKISNFAIGMLREIID